MTCRWFFFQPRPEPVADLRLLAWVQQSPGAWNPHRVSVQAGGVNWLPQAPFQLTGASWLSLIRPVPPDDDAEQFAGDRVFEAANGSQFGLARSDAFGDAVLRAWLLPRAPDGDDVKGAVGRAIASPGTAAGYERKPSFLRFIPRIEAYPRFKQVCHSVGI